MFMGMMRYNITRGMKSWPVMSRAPRKALSNPWAVVNHRWLCIPSRQDCIPRLAANSSISTRATFPIKYSLGGLTTSLQLWSMRMARRQDIRRRVPWLWSPKSLRKRGSSCKRPQVEPLLHPKVLRGMGLQNHPRSA